MPENELEGAVDEKVVAQLSSRKAEQRAEAEETLERLGPEAVDALLGVLRVEARKKQVRMRVLGAAVCAYVVIMIVLAATGHASQLGSFGGMFGGISALAAASQVQKNAARQLARHHDPRIAGPLLEALEYQDKGVRADAAGRLTQLLPTLRATHTDLLTDAQRLILAKSLRMGELRTNTGYQLAALKALQQVGDEKSIPIVERFYASDGSGPAAQAVRDEARVTLGFLRERAERERIAHTLLRPSMDPASPAEMLLRPAAGAGDTDPDVLLRPVDADPA